MRPFGAEAASTSNETASYEQSADHLHLTLHNLKSLSTPLFPDLLDLFGGMKNALPMIQ